MSLYTIMLLHIVANLVCWGRWAFTPHEKPHLVIWVIIGFVAGWIPMWPSNLATSWFLTVLIAVAEAAWFIWNMRAAEDSCLDKTKYFFVPDELKRYAPDSD